MRDNLSESFLDARRLALSDQMQSSATLPSSSRPPPPLPQAQGDTALCPCPPRCWGTCKRCRKERCDRPADHEESCWCGCDRPTPPPTPPADSRLPPSSPHVQRERPHDREMKKWRALDKWASLVSKYWRALWASQALDLPVATERAKSILEPCDRRYLHHTQDDDEAVVNVPIAKLLELIRRHRHEKMLRSIIGGWRYVTVCLWAPQEAPASPHQRHASGRPLWP